MTAFQRVLVVDDDPAMREMVVSLLEAEGLQVASASGGRAALERACDEPFDAVLSDLQMPGGDGRELAAALRQRIPDVPVILMTSFGTPESAAESLRTGAFDQITKPFRRVTVLAALSRAFEHRRLTTENRCLRRALDQTTTCGDR